MRVDNNFRLKNYNKLSADNIKHKIHFNYNNVTI